MLVTEPDIEFIKKIKKTDASFKNCMQCGNCSVVCSLSPEDRPFPRKEMIYATWGLSEILLGDPYIWQCYQCGDCTQYCPRGVKPSEILASIRQYSYLHYARPRFMAKVLHKPALLPVAVFIPALIISLIMFAAGKFRIPAGPVNYSKFFPHGWLNSSFIVLTLVTLLAAWSGIRKFWINLDRQYSNLPKSTGLFKSLIKLRWEIILHSGFGKCETQKQRKTAHLLVFYGFFLLLGVTVYAIYAATTGKYPLSIRNPVKILGNMAALMLFLGTGIMIFNRITNKTDFGTTSYPDWLLLISLFLLTFSGVLVETARYLNWSSAYFIYFIHLILVWFIIIYLPYTKFGHFIYRLVALVFLQSRNTGDSSKD